MTLLFEYSEAKVKTDKKGCFVEGCIARAGLPPNKNNRVYGEDVLSEAMQELSEKVKGGNAFGTLGHSSNPGIEHDKISHVIENIKQVGNEYHSRVRLIPEGAGKIASAILESGGSLGFSTKSVGDVQRHKDGYDLIKPGLKIHSIDLVSDPSSGQFAKHLKESILSEAFTPEEKDIALKILAENDAPSLIDRTLALLEGRNLGMDKLDKWGHGLSALQQKMEIDNTGGIFDGHAAFASLDDPGTTHYERERSLTLKIIANLLGLQADMESVDSSQSDDTGLNTRHAPGYIKRSLQTRYDRNLEDTIRRMIRQPVNQQKLQRFKGQQDLNWKTLSRIFKGI